MGLHSLLLFSPLLNCTLIIYTLLFTLHSALLYTFAILTKAKNVKSEKFTKVPKMYHIALNHCTEYHKMVHNFSFLERLIAQLRHYFCSD